MADSLGLYPLSTLAGDAIPYDVIRPIGLTSLAFTDVVSAPITIPAATGILALWSSTHCIISFDDPAEDPLDGSIVTGAMLIPANTFMNVDHNAAAELTVIGIQEGGGVLYVVFVDKWKGLQKPSQYNRN